jgi:hypothetical protein
MQKKWLWTICVFSDMTFQIFTDKARHPVNNKKNLVFKFFGDCWMQKPLIRAIYSVLVVGLSTHHFSQKT